MSDSFEHKKSLGQHFLNSPVVPGWMCDAAELKGGEVVLEIGPGTGALTAELLKRGVQVVALEADTRAIAELEKTFANEIADDKLQVVHGDARAIDFAGLGLMAGKYKIVANIPYYLSGLLFRQCLESQTQPNTLVFLVQKEVAKRATANLENGEKESLLSLSVQAYGEARYVKSVGRGHFVPPPKVDSAIITITKISKSNFSELPEAFFFELLHLGFGQKRKQLLGNLANQYDRQVLTNIFSTLDIPLSTRAEDVSLSSWLALAKSLYSTLNPQ